MDEPLINSIQVILRATMGGRSVASAEGIATLQSLCQEVGCPYHDELCSTTCCVALVVLWMGLHQEKFPLLATTLQAAAGVAGSQRWALILPSSARVSLVILYLGDTRSADDLSVFTKMAPERLCLGCGLRVDEPFRQLQQEKGKNSFTLLRSSSLLSCTK